MKQEDSQQRYDIESQNQLLEIYKIQIQSTDGISNRRATLTRYYLIVLSALVFGLYKLAENPNTISEELLDLIGVKEIVAIIAIIGMLVSWVWIIQIDKYVQLNSRKFNALKDLEKKLQYQFYDQTLSYLDEKNRNKSYQRRAYYHFNLPAIFFLLFSVTFDVMVFKMGNIISILALLPLGFIALFMISRYNQKSLEKSHT